jgi:hypothetical protein
VGSLRCFLRERLEDVEECSDSEVEIMKGSGVLGSLNRFSGEEFEDPKDLLCDSALEVSCCFCDAESLNNLLLLRDEPSCRCGSDSATRGFDLDIFAGSVLRKYYAPSLICRLEFVVYS